MIFPSFDDPFGKKKLGERPPVKAPADLNWDAIEAKIRQRKQPTNTGEPRYDSSGYLARMRQEDPWPTQDDKTAVTVSLFNCRFLNPDELVPDEVCTVACDVKILKPPSSRNVLFQLFLQGSGNTGWEEAGSLGNVSVKSSPTDQTVQVDLLLRSPDRRPELGSTVHFKVTAQHNEASGRVESPDTAVKMRNLCRYVGAPEILFRNDGDCPTLEKSGGLVRALAAAVNRLSMKPPEGQSPDTVVIAGFASASGTPEHDRDLSKRRAHSIKSLLGRDPDAWGKLAADFKTEDIQQILSGLTSGFGWRCDPGAVDGEGGPKTQAGVKAFQAECNRRYSLGLEEDGVCGPKTWGAVHRAICALVAEVVGQDPSAEPSWPDVPWGYREGQGVYACGSDFAAADDSAADRHVEICFFESNMRPPLVAPAPGVKATLAEYPVEDPEKIVKKAIDLGVVPQKSDGALNLGGTVFSTSSAVPAPKDANRIVRLLALALRADDTKELVISGHADPAGTEASNQALSEDRAKATLSLATGDQDMWWSAIQSRRDENDVSAWMTHFHDTYGWDCDPSTDSDKGVSGFQAEFNFRFDGTLAEDGIMGEHTWKALHQAVHSFVEFGSSADLGSVKKPALGLGGKGWIGFGEDFHAERMACVVVVPSGADESAVRSAIDTGPAADPDAFADDIFSIDTLLVTNSGIGPVSHHQFVVNDEGDPKLVVISDEEGRLRIPDLPSGEYSFKSSLVEFAGTIGSSASESTTFRLEDFLMPPDPEDVPDLGPEDEPDVVDTTEDDDTNEDDA